ncbi:MULTISPECIES: hypothetical protein [Bacteroidaceae]|uniref:hypothetical protein n=1 Tax=Bacteroidaceae TaxID=815 RepID=UPI0012FD7156|nr:MULTISPECIES: hypothetical protein [Bacteroidaceae]MCE9068649.1 hypothetical protein [Phocaeicola vulgatus]MDU3580004.1 hypothetical protein [Bacteroides caccae]MDU3629595.1 hypothetical protein [Bacteroides caccae]MDU3672379.1 hypothetical protein [Bacteroides caccae]
MLGRQPAGKHRRAVSMIGKRKASLLLSSPAGRLMEESNGGKQPPFSINWF